MKTSLYARTLFAMASLALVNAAVADQNTKEGYALGTPNKTIVMNGSNTCWKTGSWTSDMAIAELDPSLVKSSRCRGTKSPNGTTSDEARGHRTYPGIRYTV